MNDDEKFFAWLDGELAPAEAAAMEARVAADPRLSAMAAEHRGMQSRLSGAFDSVLEAPVPDNLQAALRPPAEVIDFNTKKRARSIPSLPQWAAIAATLALGFFGGTMVPRNDGGPVAVQGDTLYAASALNHALDTELASAPTGAVRIGLTYRDQTGEICRSFTQATSSGLACRSGGRWKLKGLFAAPEGQSGDYRMAAGMDPNLAALVGSTMAGEPFDAAQERAAKETGWR